MAEYKAIHGFTVQNRTTDPLAPGIPGATWATGGTMNTARSEIGGGGIQTSAMVAGGRNATLINNVCEIYNGTSWSEIAEINTTARGRLGAGADNEAFISIGGNPNVVNTETWNGSSWTEVGNLATKKAATYGNTGTVTAALAVGGGSPNTTNELWNGASWTEVGDLNTGGGDIGFFGTSTSAIIAGGNRPAQVAICESWNGTSWTEVADLNQSRENCAGGGSSNTAGIVFGGYKDGTGDLAFTESWDGTSWTEIADLATARFSAGGSGSETSALCSGGRGGDAYQAATEEFTAAQITDSIINTGQVFYRSDTGDLKVTLNVLGTGAFSTGTNLPGVRDYTRGIGIQTASLCMGGTNTSPSYAEATDTLSYNGTAWTELAAFNTVRHSGTWAADGTQAAAIMAGGEPPALSDTETWDGSSWTEVNNLNTARDNCTSTSEGTSTASLAFMGGTPAPNTAKTELWNGTNWTEVGDLNTSRERGSGGGSSTAAIAIDGAQAPAAANPDGVSYTEIWNGTSWTEVADTNTAHYWGAGWGTTTSALIAGTNPVSNVVEQWNGTAWSEVAEMGTNRILHGGGVGGSGNSSGIIHGGDAPPYSAAVEEWNIPSTATNTTITD